MIDILSDAKEFLDKLKSNSGSSITYSSIIDILSCSTTIFDKSKELVTETKNAVNFQERLWEKIQIDTSDSPAVIHHDPGLRKPIKSDAERKYLLSLGPNQPHLQTHPLDERNRFSKLWFKEYADIEYSVVKNVCFLFCLLFISLRK